MIYRTVALVAGLSLGIAGGLPSAIASPPQQSSRPVEMAQASALNGDWTLVGWGDPNNLTPPVPGTEVTANFTSDRISGSGGCNNYSGTFDVTGNKMSIGPVASTRIGCPSPIADQELQYFNALENTETYRINPQGQLELIYVTDDGTGILMFEQKAVPALW